MKIAKVEAARAEREAALEELVATTLLQDWQADIVLGTAACYIGWQAVAYLDRALEDLRRRFAPVATGVAQDGA